MVVVTHNRADLLARMLDGLARPRPAGPTRSSSSTTPAPTTPARCSGQVTDLPLQVTHSEENLGGAGGFHLGVEQAYHAGHDRIWLMDDDVVPAADCLAVLLAHDESCLMAVREDLPGRLVEKAAVHFDLRRPHAIRPKRSSVETTYADPRRRCPSGWRSRTSRSRGSWCTAG